MAPSTEGEAKLSEYEEQRNERIARNNRYLAQLGFHTSKKRPSDGQPSCKPKKPKGAAPSRASARQQGASAPDPASPVLFASEAREEERPLVMDEDDLEQLAPWLRDFAHFLRHVAKSAQRGLPGQAHRGLSNNNFRKTLLAIVALVKGEGIDVGFGARERKVYHRYHPAPHGESLHPVDEPWTEHVVRQPRKLELTDALDELHQDAKAFERWHSRGKNYAEETDKGWTLRHPLNKLLEFRESLVGAEWVSKLTDQAEEPQA